MSSPPRVLLVAPDDGHTATYLARAFQQVGWGVDLFDYRAWTTIRGPSGMESTLLARSSNADLVLILKGEAIYPNTIHELSRDHTVALWSFDPRDGETAWVLERAQAVDHFFTIANGLVPGYKACGINAHWLLEAADPDLHHPLPYAAPGGVSFVGTIRDVPGREEWLRRICQRFPQDVKLWGSFPTIGLSAWHQGRAEGDVGFNRVVSSSLVNLGRDRNPEIERSYGARLFRTLAAGGYLVTNDTLGIQEDLGGCLATYHDDDHCLATIESALANPEHCRDVARRGRERVLAHHTWRHRVEELLRVTQAGDVAVAPPREVG